eukprot:1155758-Pelagomonas_calceolata.AAC.2
MKLMPRVTLTCRRALGSCNLGPARQMQVQTRLNLCAQSVSCSLPMWMIGNNNLVVHAAADQYTHKLDTTGRASENRNTPHSQVMEPGAPRKPS